MYSETFLGNSIKLLRNPLPPILQTFFPQRALKKDTWTLKAHSRETQRALEHSKGTRKALQRHLGELRARGYSNT